MLLMALDINGEKESQEHGIEGLWYVVEPSASLLSDALLTSFTSLESGGKGVAVAETSPSLKEKQLSLVFDYILSHSSWPPGMYVP